MNRIKILIFLGNNYFDNESSHNHHFFYPLRRLFTLPTDGGKVITYKLTGLSSEEIKPSGTAIV